MDPAWFEELARRTAIDIHHRIIRKGFVAKDPFLTSCVRSVTGYFSHVRRHPTLLTADIVFARAILVIGYDRAHGTTGVVLMLSDQLEEPLVFCD
jgi:hypothetical protein